MGSLAPQADSLATAPDGTELGVVVRPLTGDRSFTHSFSADGDFDIPLNGSGGVTTVQITGSWGASDGFYVMGSPDGVNFYNLQSVGLNGVPINFPLTFSFQCFQTDCVALHTLRLRMSGLTAGTADIVLRISNAAVKNVNANVIGGVTVSTGAVPFGPVFKATPSVVNGQINASGMSVVFNPGNFETGSLTLIIEGHYDGDLTLTVDPAQGITGVLTVPFYMHDGVTPVSKVSGPGFFSGGHKKWLRANIGGSYAIGNIVLSSSNWGQGIAYYLFTAAYGEMNVPTLPIPAGANTVGGVTLPQYTPENDRLPVKTDPSMIGLMEKLIQRVEDLEFTVKLAHNL